MTSLIQHSNNYVSTINGAITDVATSITVTSATGLPSISGSQYFYLTMNDGTNIEIVKVTGVAGSVLTVVRAQQGTTGYAFADLDSISNRLTRDVIDGKQDQIASSTDVIDFGDATSFEIPNSASPTVDAAGEIAIDTSVTDFSTGVKKWYGSEEMGDVSMPIAEFTSPTDGHVVTYDAANDEFKLAAGGGATEINFKAYRSASVQSISASTVTLVQLDAESFDSDNYFDSTTNYRFTPLTAGKYFVVGQIRINALASGKYCNSYIYKNGALDSTCRQWNGDASAETVYVFTTSIISFNGSTDYIDLRVFHNDTVSRDLDNNVYSSYLVGYYIGA